MRRCAALLIVIFASTPPCYMSAQQSLTEQHVDISTSGNAFLQNCAAVEQEQLSHIAALQSSNCLGYIEGFIGALSVAHSVHNLPVGCLPDGVENVQAFRVIAKFIKDNPDKSHLHTNVLVWVALNKAFPCANKGS